MQRWSIAGLCIGGIMGAGFASGQELTVFFVNYGWGGLAGIGVAIGVLLLGIMLILEFGAKHNVRSYVDLFAALDPRLAGLFDALYSLFLLMGLAVMLAGMSAMGSTPISSLCFRMGSAVLIVVVVSRGVQGILRMSGWLAPALIVALCVLGSRHLKQQGIALPTEGSWLALEAAGLYACYNLGFSLAVLASLQHHLQTRAQRWQLALGVSLALGLCMVILYFALGTLSANQLQAAFPVEQLVANWSSQARRIYQVVLWSAMYTTAVANSLALVSRGNHRVSSDWLRTSVLVVAAGVFLSYFGFTTLIRVAYPILGLAGLWILANLLRQHIC